MNNKASSPKNPLFRVQVIEQQADRLHGHTLHLPHVRHSVFAALLLIWLLAVVFWLITNTYTRKETVVGWLNPPAGVV